jgi:hypothetical protein
MMSKTEEAAERSWRKEQASTKQEQAKSRETECSVCGSMLVHERIDGGRLVCRNAWCVTNTPELAEGLITCPHCQQRFYR